MAWLRRLARALLRGDESQDLAHEAWIASAREITGVAVEVASLATIRRVTRERWRAVRSPRGRA